MHDIAETELISKRIIQIWGGGTSLPLVGQASAASVRSINPDYEYVLFGDSEMKDFVEHYEPDIADLFRRLEPAIYRYDLFRYLAVYHLGGFYFDTDIFLAKGLNPLLQHGCVFPFERLTWSSFLREARNLDWEIGNYAFGAERNHPFVRAVISNCVRALTDAAWRDEVLRGLPKLLRDDLEVIYTTGPGLVTRTLVEYEETVADIEVLFSGDVTDRANWNLIGEYGFHLGSGAWRRSRSSLKRRLVNYLGRLNEDRAIRTARRLGPTRRVGEWRTR